MISDRTNRAFLLFFSGYSQAEIAVELHTFTTNINTLLRVHGQEWISTYLKPEHKDKLLKLSTDGFNTQEIADKMGKPWTRWNIQFALRRLKAEEKFAHYKQIYKDKEQGAEFQPKATKHNYRCANCSRPFEQTLAEAAFNPDRLCSTCTDRRLSERRSRNRVDDAS